MSTLNWTALVVLAACGVHVGSFRLSGRHMFGLEGAAPAAGRPAMSNTALNGPWPSHSRGRNKFMENDGLFEGDIVLKGFDPTFMSIAISWIGQFWPDGRVYYEVHESLGTASMRRPHCPHKAFNMINGWQLFQGYLSFTSADKSDTITEALTDFTKKTCVEFIRCNGDKNVKDYVLMRGDTSGCWSYMGMQGGEQEISLEKYGCLGRDVIIHEAMHALGFWHEQSRPDRDDFVTIVWDNIETGKENNFKKAGRTQDTEVGTAYDYSSVMHYPLHAFAKNANKPTIVPKVDVDTTKVPGMELSPLDVEQIRQIYKCLSHHG